jgi:hypothetical protein
MTANPVTLTLTTASARILAAICATPGLVTDPVKLFRVGSFAEQHLSDLTPEPKGGDESALTAWATASLAPIQTTAKVRDTLRELVTAAIGKGMVGGHRDVLALMRVFGLDEDA